MAVTADIGRVAERTRLTRSVLYWTSTLLAAAAFAGLGAANLAHAAPIMKGMGHLGYPPYFATILGAWKVLAAAVLLAPSCERVRDWAYAGMFFTLTGAALSHAFNRDSAVTIVAPLALLGIVTTSQVLGEREGRARRV